jgi:hypothetical protein
MTSLFSRSRTKSTPQKSKGDSTTLPLPSSSYAATDEFGRVSSRHSAKESSKKKDKERLRTLSTKGLSSTDITGRGDVLDSPVPHSPLLTGVPDGSFLPPNVDSLPLSFGPGLGASSSTSPSSPALSRAASSAAGSDRDQRERELEYGYLGYEPSVILGIDQVDRLVQVVCEELGTRGGITTPFIFSSLALDISMTAIKRLVQAFLRTCERSGRLSGNMTKEEAEAKWREEARFAGMHELGMLLRWGMARVVRVVNGQEVRGLVGWEQYLEYKESEKG